MLPFSKVLNSILRPRHLACVAVQLSFFVNATNFTLNPMATEEKKEPQCADNSYTYTLNDGNKIPIIGFGTYQIYNKACTKAVEYAISIGYRHIDTAIFYSNEEEVGAGIKNANIDRKELFITTKLWSDDHEQGNGETANAVNSSLKNLGLDYIDLYLIHSPHGENNILTYKELIKFQKKGFIKSIGVSNYGIQHLQALEKAGLPLPVVNQIELHPWLQQKKIVNYCRSKNILIESYSPLTKGQKLKQKNNMLKEMVKKYENKSIAQLLLKWNVQTGHIVIAKSKNNDRIKQNFDTLEWNISNQDMEILNGFDSNYHCTWDPTTTKVNGKNW
eukprot:445655_1